MKKSEMEFPRIRAYYELLSSLRLLEDVRVRNQLYIKHDVAIVDIIRRHRVWSRETRDSDFTDLVERDLMNDEYIKSRMVKQLICLQALKEQDKKRKSVW